MGKDDTKGKAANTGILYVVATPIGNLGDIGLRALEVLKKVDLIAAEDTRQTRKLLSRYSISRPLVSYYEHNELISSRSLLEKLKENKDIALVSNAGTPLISDPGYRMVELAIKGGIKIIPIPGPSALICALQVSGAATDSFVFEGYLPPKTKKRKDKLTKLKEEKRTVIFYETPHRLLACFKDMLNILGDRDIIIGRELTKKFEEMRREKISQAIEHFVKNRPRGEFVVILPKK